MISWAVGFDGRVMEVVYDDTHRWLLGSCMKFCQTAVLVVKGLVQSYETGIVNGKLDLLCTSV